MENTTFNNKIIKSKTKMDNNIITSKNVNLTNCDREQIHIPCAIQPHGVLIVLEKNSLNIIQVSDNINDFLNINFSPLINSSITNLIGVEQTELIEKCLNKDFAAINPLRIIINDSILNCIVHEINNYINLELEIVDTQQKSDFFGFYQMTRGIIADMQKAFNLTELSEVIVKNIRALTGFDRVMVYHFDEDESGHVIAENKREDLESFYGLHYPRTDVPKPARRLYLLNYIRLIPKINYQEVTLPNHPETNERFDLSYSILRSVSPIHIEYLKNMGVKASMSISLISNGKLWGLIACHHYQETKYIPYEIRTACEFLGQVMSLELTSKEENESLDYKMQLKDTLAKLIKPLSYSNNLIEDLIKNSDNLKLLVNSDGLAISDNDDIYLSGKTPSKFEVEQLINWLNKQIERDIFYTDKLPKIYPPSEEFKEVASGVLALCLNQVTNHYIIWFRSEVIQTVKWAGNPNKSAVIEEDGTITLSPRKSFELWKENISCQSLPWQKYEIQQVMELRILIVEIIFKKAYELAQLNSELLRSNEELDSFAYVASHDLKEPLRGISNYSQFLLEDYENILDEDGVHKLNTLIVLTKRMENLIEALLHYSRIGRKELDFKVIKVENIINNIKMVLEASLTEKIDIRIPRQLPLILGDNVLIEEVFTNLITNACKYNNSPQKWVEIGYLEDEENETNKNKLSFTTFYLKDNGIGILEKHKDIVFRIFKRLHGQNKYGGGTGAGLTIVKKIIERHNGNIWLESVYEKGTTFYFTLPTNSIS